MSIWFGVGLSALKRWTDKSPFVFARVETLFWVVCVGFLGLIVLALWLQAAPPQ